MQNIDTSKWGNGPIESFARWEQREIYSYYDIDENETNIGLVNDIIQSIRNNETFEWISDDLNLMSEALIQKKLREEGYELQCWLLDEFPTSSGILKLKLVKEKPSLFKSKVIKPTVDFLNKYFEKTKKIARLQIVYLILATIGLYWYSFDLFWWGLLASFLISNTISIVTHYTWWHKILKPKNKYIGYILDFYSIIFYTPAVGFFARPKKSHYGHIYHHRFFGQNTDPITRERCRMGGFKYYIEWGKKDDMSDEKSIDQIADREYPLFYNSLDPMNKFLEDNTFLLVLISHTVLFFLLGLHYYFYFIFLPIVYWRIGKNLVEALAFHHDNFWLFPMYLENAYHRSHHEYSNKVILGPRIFKYINPQYYFLKLFYNYKEDDIMWIDRFPLPIWKFNLR